MVNHRLKNHVKSIGATPVVKYSPAWTASRLINAFTLERNRTSALVAISVSLKRRVSIGTSRRTRNALQNARAPPVAKHSTTSHPTTFIYAPRINKKQPPLAVNDQPQKHQMLRRQRNLRKPQILLHQPFLKRQPLLLLLLVLVGKKILSSSRPTLFQALTKILLGSFVNTGPRSEHGSAVTTDFRTGIISASPPSVQPASENN